MTATQDAQTSSAEVKLRVLVVDDDSDQTEGLKDLLEPRGYQVAVAHSIEETRRRLEEYDAQIAVIELRLGNENGIDLVRELKDSHPQLKCILLTAYAELDSTIEAVKLGVFDFFRKPLSPASLFLSLDLCCEQIKHEREKNQAKEALEKRIVALTQPLEESDECIDFTELFNLDEIQHIQDAFAKATGVASIITHTDGTPITNPSNFCRLCKDIIRQTPDGLRKCHISDSIIGRYNPEGPNVQHCLSCGLLNAGAGITVGGKRVANWLIGQARSEAQDEDLISKYAIEIGADEEDFRKAFREVPVMSEEQFNNVAQMLFDIASQLSTLAYQNVQQARFITARKEAEDKLKSNEARLEALVALGQMTRDPIKEITDYALEEAIRLTRSEIGYLAFTEDDESVLAMYSFSKAVMPQCKVMDSPSRFPVETTGLLVEAIRQRKPVVINDYAAPNPLKKGYPEGHVEVMRHMNVPVFDGDKIVAVAGVGNKDSDYDDSDVRQLTMLMAGMWGLLQRKQAKEQLQLERDFSTQIINSLPGLFYVFDEQRFVKWNPQWEKITGYTSEELGKLYATEFFEGADKKLITERVQEVFREGITESEAEIVTKDGRKIPYYFTGARCMFDGVPHFVGLGIDITARKAVEAEREQLIDKLEAQNAELERFTYTVSHDLKSPLITVKGFVGMMQQDLAKGDTVAVNDDLARIANAADKMDQLLRDLLELSRIGRLVNVSEEISLEELTKEALEMAHGQIVSRGVEIKVSPDLPLIHGDRLRLLEVLQNLIDNAVKYIGAQPHPCIEIGFRRDGSETVFYVRDNGIGIESNYKEKVFGLFEQLDQNVEGSGIGLALAKRIIEIHGGRIWVESQGLGHGSTFCFTLAKKSDNSSEESVGNLRI